MEIPEEELRELREAVQVGLDQLDAEQGDVWDVESTKARLRERVENGDESS
jgi:hypothetical protein